MCKSLSVKTSEGYLEDIFGGHGLDSCVFVGHVNTDLDSVAAAVAAAALFGGSPARSEKELNGEILYALKYADIVMPALFDDFDGAKPVCLVDHNEEKQMHPLLRNDKGRIRGLIDHHALASSFTTSKPLFMDVRPWGSSATIITHMFVRRNLVIPKNLARLLLCAVLSDTLDLQSVTTTHADRLMVTLLAMLGDVEDPSEIARQQFKAKTDWIVNLGPYEMCRGDQKDFEAHGWKFGIAVLEVTAPAQVLLVAHKLLLELRMLKKEKGNAIDERGKKVRWKARELDFAFLFIVDVTKQKSDLLICGGRELALAKHTFPKGVLRCLAEDMHPVSGTITPENTCMDVGGMVSRKADFVPAFSNALKTFTYKKLPTAQSTVVLNLEEIAHGTNGDVVVTDFEDSWKLSDKGQVIERDYAALEKGLASKVNRPSRQMMMGG
jgi:inorganic pyrophosphatase/exopolyphosphatase